MPFPDKDPLYDEAALFLESHMKAGETVVALSEFRDRFPQNAVLDLMTTKKPGGFQWAVIHRAAVHRVAPDLLARIARCCRPVYENGLFLIFSDRPDLAVLDEPSFAVKDFRRKVRAIGLASRLLDAELFLEAGKTDWRRKAFYGKMACNILPGIKKAVIRPHPVFIHSLWRTGSTYIWNKFRESGGFYTYYEPFNEQYLWNTRENFETEFGGGKAAEMSHPELSNNYAHEFPIYSNGGVPLFRKSFSYDDYCLEAGQDAPHLERYVGMLARYAPRRPVFQFCRSTLRAGWLRDKFNSVNIYILRSPRDQWESYLSFKSNYFNIASFIIAGKNGSSRLIAPLTDSVHIPYFDDDDLGREYAFYSEVTGGRTLPEQYFVFYYMWLVSLLCALPVCNIVMDMDLVSEDGSAKRAVEGVLKRHSLEMTLDDCRIKKYARFTLPEVEMSRVESDVQALIKSRLGHEFERCKGSIRELSPLISREHREIFETS